MALQYPNIVPTGYNGDYSDFLQAKVDKSGAMRLLTGSVSIPSGTASGQIIGIMPVRKAFKLSYGATWLNIGALSTSVTIALGYYYQDTTLGTSATAGYLAASTTAAAGGVITPNVVAGALVDIVSDAWIVAVIGGATTGTTGTLTYQMGFVYDISGVSN